VVSVTGLPATGAVVSEPVGPSVTVTLSEPLDPLTVNAAGWSLRGAGADGVLDTADDQAAEADASRTPFQSERARLRDAVAGL
jgi:hypothetical protein